MAPTKSKRVSKKNKSSWRKNIDVKDVENFLEDKRLEERLGVNYSEQKNEDLFQIDTKSAKEVKNETKIKVPVYSRILTTEGQSKRLRETEIPKCFEILGKRSAVPPIIINKTRFKRKNGNSYVAKAIIKRKAEKEILKAKSIIQKSPTSDKNRSTRPGFTYDLWSKEEKDRELNGFSEWLSNDTLRHTLSNTGKFKKVIPEKIQSKTSLLPAIEAPHPGSSYNPSLKDHLNILEKVAESEIKLLKEEKHLDRVTTKMFNKIPREKLEKEWLSEMTVGLTVKKTESDEEDTGEYKAVNPPVKNKKKTLKKRRKLKEAMLLKQKLLHQKIEKKKLSDIYKLRKFKEALDKKEEKTLQNIEKRKQMKKIKPYTTKLLCQNKYKEPEMEFKMPEELSGNLRNVQPEGCILYDRFKSLQKRNVLQPTLKRYVKKRKQKKYERAHTKMEWEEKGYTPYEESKGLVK